MTPKKILALQNFVGIFQNFLDFFSSNSEKNIIFRNCFSRKILLNDYDFWHFSINPLWGYGKMPKVMVYEGLWENAKSHDYLAKVCV